VTHAGGHTEWPICALLAGPDIRSASGAYSAFSAAVDPNRTTEMTIAAIDPDMQNRE